MTCSHDTSGFDGGGSDDGRGRRSERPAAPSPARAQARSGRRVDPDLAKRLAGYSLTTAEIIYRLPDAQSLLQSYVWQEYDLAPRFPRLQAFLAFWERELDGPIHSVRVAHDPLIRPAAIRLGAELNLH